MQEEVCQTNKTWKPVTVYLIFGPLAGYAIILLKESPSFDLVILFLGFIFAYALGFIPAWLAGFITASLIKIFKFWSNDSWVKFIILGPLLGASLSLPVALLFVGEKSIEQLIQALIMGGFLGSFAYTKTL